MDGRWAEVARMDGRWAGNARGGPAGTVVARDGLCEASKIAPMGRRGLGVASSQPFIWEFTWPSPGPNPCPGLPFPPPPPARLLI